MEKRARKSIKSSYVRSRMAKPRAFRNSTRATEFAHAAAGGGRVDKARLHPRTRFVSLEPPRDETDQIGRKLGVLVIHPHRVGGRDHQQFAVALATRRTGTAMVRRKQANLSEYRACPDFHTDFLQ